MKEEDVRKKMAEWPGLFGRLEGLLANVTNANNTAHDAIARGEETLRKAKDMLERLKVKIFLKIGMEINSRKIANQNFRLRFREMPSKSPTSCSRLASPSVIKIRGTWVRIPPRSNNFFLYLHISLQEQCSVRN